MRALCLVGALLLSGCVVPPRTAPPFEQPTIARATIGVAVLNDAGQPVEGATVSLHTGECGTTDANGYVAFLGLTLGERGITVEAEGYRPATSEARPFTSNRHITVLLDPLAVVTSRPLIGPLRVQDRLFVDDTGYRRVFFASWFTALRVLRDNPAEFHRQLDEIARAGYQGARVFLAVGGWMGFWDGAEVVPVSFRKWYFDRNDGGHSRPPRGRELDGTLLEAWPDYDDLYRTLLREFRKRKLRLHVTTGDMQIIVGPDTGKELDLHRRLARIAAEEGGLDVIALAEATNEFPLNRFGHETEPSIEQMGRILRIWQEAIPGVLTAQGAIPQNEEPDGLRLASRYGEVVAVHVTRSPQDMALKRAMGLVYWEGNYRSFPKPYWQGEPAGPGADSFDEQFEPAFLTALYAVHALTGQASNYFNGPAVRGCVRQAGEGCAEKGPLESTWGFRELPALFATVLPEDIATWDRETAAHGAILYWTREKDFRAIVLDGWDTTPPRPVAEWTIYAGDQVHTGTGTPERRTGLLVGRFQ